MAMVSDMAPAGGNRRVILPDVASACQPPTILRGFPAAPLSRTRDRNIPTGAALIPHRRCAPMLHSLLRRAGFDLPLLGLVPRLRSGRRREHGYSDRAPAAGNDDYCVAQGFRLTVPIHPAIISANSRRWFGSALMAEQTPY